MCVLHWALFVFFWNIWQYIQSVHQDHTSGPVGCGSNMHIFQVFIPILFYSFRWKWRSDDSTYFRLHINPNTSWRNSIWTMSTMLAPTLGPWEPAKCDRYYTENNRTHFIYGGYEGIPENLLINFVAWVVSLLPTSNKRKGMNFSINEWQSFPVALGTKKATLFFWIASSW